MCIQAAFKTYIANVPGEGPIASLGGFISAPGIIPKTRSGKTLRRCLKEALENGLNGEFEKEVTVPATVEDPAVVEKARAAVKVSRINPSDSQRHYTNNVRIYRSTSRRVLAVN